MSDPVIYSLTSADGLEAIFAGDSEAILTTAGFGAPPTLFTTVRRSSQAGVSELAYRLQPRGVSLELWEAHSCDRQSYWDNRARLHNLLRPNRGGALRLAMSMPSGARRALDVWPSPGLIFPAKPDDNSWMIGEVVDFVAYDPIWYDPDPVTHTFTGAQGLVVGLAFPITFPITFGNQGLLVTTGEFVYPGTWRTYPIVTITGPYQYLELESVASGAVVILNNPLPTGETRVIDFTPGQQSVKDGNGVKNFTDVDPASDFINFAILPDGEVGGGLNEIAIRVVGAEIATTLSIAYYDRYFAL